MKKIERKQTRDHITQMIRYEILSGSMKPGDELAQESIAEQLGLSRMPVREALQALEQEGFLVRLPNRHMQVSRLEPDHVSHIFQAIAAMARARELGHPGERIRELAFHQALISYIDNRYLEKIYQQFLDGYIGYVILYLKEDNQESAQILSSLMDAIQQGDRAEIAQETQRYFLSLAEIMRQHMKDWESAEASIREN